MDRLAGILRAAAPQLAGYPIELARQVPEQDPLWWSATAVLGGEFVAKFAWSPPAAARVAHEAGVLTALAGSSEVPFLPEVVVTSADPALLVTRRVSGVSLFEVIGSVDRDRAGRQLATFLAALHEPAARIRVEAAVGPLPEARHGVQHPPATSAARLGPWIRAGQRLRVERWCEWAGAVLAPSRPAVLVHADLHGDNQVWDHDELRLIVDFETVCAAEPEYDFRALPLELLTATIGHYERLTGRHLALDRIGAWHLRTVLGDVLWRAEAGFPQPDGRTPADRIDDLILGLDELRINP